MGASIFAIEAMCNRTNAKCKVPRLWPARPSSMRVCFSDPWHALDMRSKVTLITKVGVLRIPMPID